MGWELYDASNAEEKPKESSGFLGIWLGIFIFVIVISLEMALLNG